MRVCVVGAGGREHAVGRSCLLGGASVVVCPGNPGMALLSGLECWGGSPEDVEADLWVVGPEAPLVAGLADRLRGAGRLVVGPGAAGAQLEGSKAWMKEVLVSAGVPTAGYGAFSSVGPALEYLRSLPPPWVVKTDGLAAGKGVLVTSSLEEASADVVAKLSGQSFGDAGRTVVIEEALPGEEISLMALCDGRRAVALGVARDYKRVGDGDAGPNTGGMGAFSPVPGIGAAEAAALTAELVQPVLDALRDRGIDYRGVLYAGLMLTPEGPKVVEFNVRLGDPEAQVLMPRWEGDVAAVLRAAAAGDLEGEGAPVLEAREAVCVVLAAEGYPGAVRSGDPIGGLAEASALEGVCLFASGVAEGPAGRLVTSGGRILGVTGVGGSLGEARERAYAGVGLLNWKGMIFRGDIARPEIGGIGGPGGLGAFGPAATGGAA